MQLIVAQIIADGAIAGIQQQGVQIDPLDFTINRPLDTGIDGLDILPIIRVARQIRTDLVEDFMAQAEKSGAVVLRVSDEAAMRKALTEHSSRDGDICVEATVAIAETGTVALHSQQVASAELYLCEHLVVSVAESAIVAYLHEAFPRPGTTLPHALHLMTGPSRTADVEQTLQIGAHGPKRQTIIVYRDR